MIDIALLPTTKVAEAESSLGLPVAVIVYVPDAVEATVNDADKVPLAIEQLKVSTGLPDNEQLVSAVEKPDPVTSTVAPTGAEAELSVIEGGAPLTVKLAEAESLPGLPLAVIVYVPDATSATTNDAYKAPSEMEQLKVCTGLPDNEQLVSAVEKPDPVTSTDVPTEAEVKLSVIDGGTALTVKLADAESPA
ncbi:MAG: hypothetical protein ACLP5V_12055 [Candidatus Bathyarchaeia archaeon]